MKILMTGSHGFVGTNLVEALSGKHEIIRWEVRSDKELPECDAVIHLAGKAHDVKMSDVGSIKAEEYFHVNTELTKKIYDAFLKSKAKKFIFFSSIKAKDVDTPYAQSKKSAEDYINDVICKREDVRRNKKIYILRPCMIHGKGVKGNLPLLFKFVKKGLPWPLAAFENQRSYASMGNVSFVVSELLKKDDVESGTYNICDDETVSTNDLIRLIGEDLDQKPKMLCIPQILVRLGVKIGDVFHLPLNTERFKKLTGDYIVDNCDIKRTLGISQMPFGAMEGFRVTIDEMNKREDD